jgi:hypothetical protein
MCGTGNGSLPLVVVDQDAAVAAPPDEARRAIRIRRGGLAGLELGHAGLRHDLVLEALGQREEPGRIVDERAVADPPRVAVMGWGG